MSQNHDDNLDRMAFDLWPYIAHRPEVVSDGPIHPSMKPLATSLGLLIAEHGVKPAGRRMGAAIIIDIADTETSAA